MRTRRTPLSRFSSSLNASASRNARTRSPRLFSPLARAFDDVRVVRDDDDDSVRDDSARFAARSIVRDIVTIDVAYGVDD